jgi:hypothetical protein
MREALDQAVLKAARLNPPNQANRAISLEAVVVP